MKLSLFVFAFLSAASAFNLNTSGPDWDYTAKDLANTTSQACKDAYSAEIDCDVTLLGLVASMRPAFQPESTDFTNTCTSTCNSSLSAYVQGVQKACTAEGDKAQESVGGGDNVDMYLDPVAIVGQIFQYEWVKDCSQLPNGTFCYFERTSYASPGDTFSCDDECAIDFYEAAHDFPASAKQFNYYWLISRGDWWASDFAAGWARVEECRNGTASTVGSEYSTRIFIASSSVASSSEASNTAAPTGDCSVSQEGCVSSTASAASTTTTASSTHSSAGTVSPTTTPSSGDLRVANLWGVALMGLLCTLIFV